MARGVVSGLCVGELFFISEILARSSPSLVSVKALFVKPSLTQLPKMLLPVNLVMARSLSFPSPKLSSQQTNCFNTISSTISFLCKVLLFHKSQIYLTGFSMVKFYCLVGMLKSLQKWKGKGELGLRCTPVIAALRRADCREFKASLLCLVSSQHSRTVVRQSPPTHC